MYVSCKSVYACIHPSMHIMHASIDIPKLRMHTRIHTHTHTTFGEKTFTCSSHFSYLTTPALHCMAGPKRWRTSRHRALYALHTHCIRKKTLTCSFHTLTSLHCMAGSKRCLTSRHRSLWAPPQSLPLPLP
jgi:hypothetical protein